MKKDVDSMTEKKVREIAQKNGIELSDKPLKFNESGLDFSVVIAEDKAGQKWVLRFPRREDVIGSAKKEKSTGSHSWPHIGSGAKVDGIH